MIRRDRCGGEVPLGQRLEIDDFPEMVRDIEVGAAFREGRNLLRPNGEGRVPAHPKWWNIETTSGRAAFRRGSKVGRALRASRLTGKAAFQAASWHIPHIHISNRPQNFNFPKSPLAAVG